MGRQLRSEEEWVRQCIQTATEGARVAQHDDGSRARMHDLDIFVNERLVGAVEVSAAVDPEATELWRLVGAPGQWADGSLRGGWNVRLQANANARALKAHLSSLLRALESQGRRHLWSGGLHEWSTEETLADQLGIISAHQHPTAKPGSVYPIIDFAADQQGGAAPDSADGVSLWVEGWLGQPHQRDNLDKLAGSGASERHMAIVVPGFSPAPFEVIYALIDDEVSLPSLAPRLPEEVTHCWILSTWNTGRGLRWSPLGWNWFSKLQPSTS